MSNRMLPATRAVHEALQRWAQWFNTVPSPAPDEVSLTLAATISSLPERQYWVLIECYLRPASMSEIAKRLGISLNSLAVALHMARCRILRDLMDRRMLPVLRDVN